MVSIYNKMNAQKLCVPYFIDMVITNKIIKNQTAIYITNALFFDFSRFLKYFQVNPL